MIFVLMISLIDFSVLVAYAALGYDAGETDVREKQIEQSDEGQQVDSRKGNSENSADNQSSLSDENSQTLAMVTRRLSHQGKTWCGGFACTFADECKERT